MHLKMFAIVFYLLEYDSADQHILQKRLPSDQVYERRQDVFLLRGKDIT